MWCVRLPDRPVDPRLPISGRPQALFCTAQPGPTPRPPLERTMIMFPVVFESSRPGRLSFETIETADSLKGEGSRERLYAIAKAKGGCSFSVFPIRNHFRLPQPLAIISSDEG